MYTKQQTFDMVVQGLRKQGCKSISENGEVCMYRGAGGAKCAAGMLIPDEDYKPEFEFKILEKVESTNSTANELRACIGKNHDIELVRELQLIHDIYNIEAWEQRWKDLAFGYNLTYTLPANCTT